MAGRRLNAASAEERHDVSMVFQPIPKEADVARCELLGWRNIPPRERDEAAYEHSWQAQRTPMLTDEAQL
jgi:hypothetical protein